MSSKSSAGSPDSERARGCSPIVVLGAGVLALVFAALVGPRMIGILFALAAPPDPPLPDTGTLMLVSHENLAHGVDRWVYSASQDVCEIAQFYHDQGGQCPIVPPDCGVSPTGPPPPGEDVVSCYGDAEFSIFAMRWRFQVAAGDAQAGTTKFYLSRVVSWTGTLPPEAP